MELRNVSEVFHRHRELTRIVWNPGMREHPDSEIEFNEPEPSLFRALFESFITPMPIRNEGSYESPVFPHIFVKFRKDVGRRYLKIEAGRWTESKAGQEFASLAFSKLLTSTSVAAFHEISSMCNVAS